MEKRFIIFACLPLALLIVYCLYRAYTEEPRVKNPTYRTEHGIASKITFSGHSYVVWQQNLSDCIVHDPDCECKKGG